MLTAKALKPARQPQPPRHRRGGTWAPTLLALLLLGGGGWGAWHYRAKLWPAPTDTYLTCRAKLAEFTFEITERGELESSANLEVRCEVESRESRGMKILEIVPEGTIVTQGDKLIRFEDAGLQNERTLQEIAVNNAQAAATQAQNDVKSAEFTKLEYELGTYVQEKEKAESELKLAEENLKRAEEQLDYTRRMVSKGFSNRAAAEADALAASKCRRELKVAETKLSVLEEYTKPKTLNKHKADIDTAQAKVRSETAKLELETRKLAKIDEQIKKCIVTAPRDGQVIYDHSQDQWRGSDYMIKEGAVVYERRVVIRMPDPTKMQVKAKIPESRIDKLKVDMPATVEVEGLPGAKLAGKVSKVNAFPAEGNWYNSSVKEYETTIVIDDPPPGLRPGMTAQVAIRIEQLPEALQVPVQAVAEMNGRHYCLQKLGDGTLAPRPVILGTSNEKYLVIRDGLARDDELLLDPRGRLAKMDLPQPPGVDPSQPKAPEPVAKQPAAPAEATPAAETQQAAQPESSKPASAETVAKRDAAE